MDYRATPDFPYNDTAINNSQEFNEIWNSLSSGLLDFDLITPNSAQTRRYCLPLSNYSVQPECSSTTTKNYNNLSKIEHQGLNNCHLNKSQGNYPNLSCDHNLVLLNGDKKLNEYNLNKWNELNATQSTSCNSLRSSALRNMQLNECGSSVTVSSEYTQSSSTDLGSTSPSEEEINKMLFMLGKCELSPSNEVVSSSDSYEKEHKRNLLQLQKYSMEYNVDLIPDDCQINVLNREIASVLGNECQTNRASEEIVSDRLDPSVHFEMENDQLQFNAALEYFNNSNHYLNDFPSCHQDMLGTTYFYTPPPPQNSYYENTRVRNYFPTYNFVPEIPNNIQSILNKKNSSLFLSKYLRDDIFKRNMFTVLKPSLANCTNLPKNVEVYHDLAPLEYQINGNNSMYRAVHSETGHVYCLRRLHSWKLKNRQSLIALKAWKKIVHPNIVQIHEAFTTNVFGDNSMLFVYDFYPAAVTMFCRYFQTQNRDPFTEDATEINFEQILRNHIVTNKFSEDLLWNYIIQISSALLELTNNSLACRCLDPTKIIITDGTNRIKLSCTGIMDISQNYSSNDNELLEQCQQNDLTSFGKLILALACKSMGAVEENVQNLSIHLIGNYYSTDLYNLLTYLLNTRKFRRISSLIPLIGSRFYTQTNNLYDNCDYLEYELSKCLENDRLFRLISKLLTTMMVGNDKTHSSTTTNTNTQLDDKGLLELFRNYVFNNNNQKRCNSGHQGSDNLGYIVQCLNKLDYGYDEMIQLVSKDERFVVLVTYTELKQCLENRFLYCMGN